MNLFTDSTGTLADRTRRELRFPRVAGPYAGFVGEVEDPYGTPLESLVTSWTGQRMLDSRTDIDPVSLMLNGLTVSWVRGGVTRSARLT